MAPKVPNGPGPKRKTSDAQLPMGMASTGPRSARNVRGPLYGGAPKRRPTRRPAKPRAPRSELVLGNPHTAI